MTLSAASSGDAIGEGAENEEAVHVSIMESQRKPRSASKKEPGCAVKHDRVSCSKEGPRGVAAPRCSNRNMQKVLAT